MDDLRIGDRVRSTFGTEGTLVDVETDELDAYGVVEVEDARKYVRCSMSTLDSIGRADGYLCGCTFDVIARIG